MKFSGDEQRFDKQTLHTANTCLTTGTHCQSPHIPDKESSTSHYFTLFVSVIFSFKKTVILVEKACFRLDPMLHP